MNIAYFIDRDPAIYYIDRCGGIFDTQAEADAEGLVGKVITSTDYDGTDDEMREDARAAYFCQFPRDDRTTIVQVVDLYLFKQAFARCGRPNQFSAAGFEALFEHLSQEGGAMYLDGDELAAIFAEIPADELEEYLEFPVIAEFPGGYIIDIGGLKHGLDQTRGGS
jgi:hypothetical protein